MRIVFDQGTPVPLRRTLAGHTVSTAFESGWTELDNGALLAAAEAQFAYYDRPELALSTESRWATLAIVVLPTTSGRGFMLIATRLQPHSTHCVRVITWN